MSSLTVPLPTPAHSFIIGPAVTITHAHIRRQTPPAPLLLHFSTTSVADSKAMKTYYSWNHLHVHCCDVLRLLYFIRSKLPGLLIVPPMHELEAIDLPIAVSIHLTQDPQRLIMHTNVS
jgi:hypothetical protein